ncbi:MAG: hypothetical protein WCK78_01230 [Paludibacter sp.]
MKLKILLYSFLNIFLFCLNNQSTAQSIAKIDSLNAIKAKTLSNIVLGVESDSATYVIFGIDDKFLFINKICQGYHLYSFVEKFNYTIQKEEFITNRNFFLSNIDILQKIFTQKICIKPFIYSTDTLYNTVSSDTKYIYFTKYIKGRKKCELSIPISSIPNTRNENLNSYVFDEDSLIFFIKELMEGNAGNASEMLR